MSAFDINKLLLDSPSKLNSALILRVVHLPQTNGASGPPKDILN